MSPSVNESQHDVSDGKSEDTVLWVIII